MSVPIPDYYTGDLEKRFNYFWEGGDWNDFKRMVDEVDMGKLRVGWVCAQFYSTNTERVVQMSRPAYYRWRRSLIFERTGKVA